MPTLFNALPASRTLPIVLIALWALVWKGISLWNAARERSLRWFVALLILNTAGILEIVYLMRLRHSSWLIWPLLISGVFLTYLLVTVFSALRDTSPLGVPDVFA